MRGTIGNILSAHAHYKWLPLLSDEERDSIKAYTDVSVYSRLNKLLREDNFDNASVRIQKMIVNIDKGLKKFNYPRSLTVYRAVSKEEYNLIKKNNGLNAFVDFKSTSISENFAMDFATLPTRHIVIAQLPKFADGAYIAPLSVFKEEDEFLLNRGCNYEVIKSFHEKEEDIKYVFIKVVR